MRARSTATTLGLAALLVGAAACSGHSSAGAPTVVDLPTHSAAPVSGGNAAVQNIVISDYTRSQLIVAEAKANKLPNASFIGLAKSNEYLSFDSSTKTFWAAAQVFPDPTSAAAKKAVSGRGSYQVFRQVQGKAWKIYDVGTSGSCPLTVPPAVLTAWGWSAGSCRP
jgi:hypothetical protein